MSRRLLPVVLGVCAAAGVLARAECPPVITNADLPKNPKVSILGTLKVEGGDQPMPVLDTEDRMNPPAPQPQPQPQVVVIESSAGRGLGAWPWLGLRPGAHRGGRHDGARRGAEEYVGRETRHLRPLGPVPDTIRGRPIPDHRPPGEMPAPKPKPRPRPPQGRGGAAGR